MSQSQSEAKPTQKPADEVRLATKLTGIICTGLVQFNGAHSSYQTGRNCESITPGRIDSDGSPQPIEKGQACQGFILKALIRNGNAGFVMAQTFVAWAKVETLTYS